MTEGDSRDAALVQSASDSGSQDDFLRALVSAPLREPPLIVGQEVGPSGRYVIERRLGRGGMGAVYVARDVLLRRSVALKLLHRVRTGDSADGEDPVLREARIAAVIEHDRVARVYDVGAHAGSPFVAMELVRGMTLRGWMDGRPRDIGEVLRIGVQIAEGLGVLHAHGVVHGDLKPENVMLTERGDVKLVDFGLARVAGSVIADDFDASLCVSGTHGSGAVRGTPGYMSPEQRTGGPIDARADLFALGVIVHELSTGARPMQSLPTLGATQASTLPASLQAFVARALSAAPDARHRDANEMLAALRSVGASMRRRRRSRGLAVSTLVLGFVAAAWTWPSSIRTGLPTPPGMARVDVGTLWVGQSVEEVEAECRQIGPNCKMKQMLRAVPKHRVSVPAFALDRYETTNEELAETLNRFRGMLTILDDDEHHYPRFVKWNKGLGHSEALLFDLSDTAGIEVDAERRFHARAGRARMPASHLSWFAAQLHCTRLGKRLPTEDEWEAAARGRDDRRFPWGSSLPRCGEVALPSTGNFLPTAGCPGVASVVPVGTARMDATPEGVLDLGGNVAEWTRSVYLEGDRARSPLDPDDSQPKVIRGGSWKGAERVRTSARTRAPPSFVGDDVGVRCATSLDLAPR